MDNKRNYFRVTIPIGLKYKLVDVIATKLDPHVYFDNTESEGLKRQMQYLRQTVNRNLREIPSEHEATGLAIHAIQQQLDTLTQYIRNNEIKSRQVRVSLSEGGIGFKTKEPINIEQTLVLSMELDELEQFYCYGEVKKCIQENNAFSIGIQFIELKEEDQQRLAKFVLQVDAEQRRLRRN
jgi:c-di-GMP-binding flagellar brake protein YcgR